jgi:hypothetical protein
MEKRGDIAVAIIAIAILLYHPSPEEKRTRVPR